jgi:enolase-phosphatase E1
MRGILLDIEGTTTPIAFVYDVLFPFARQRIEGYLPHADLTALRREYDIDVQQGRQPPAWSSNPVAYVHWLMDQDRKSTALKEIQGTIWREGFRRGEIHGEVFPDVPSALEHWHGNGIDIRIFSSGSILAQRSLFSSTPAGDLTRFLRGYFDTTTGPKQEAASYRTIAESFEMASGEILFISDITRELDAARGAGMETTLCIRPGNHPQPPTDHPMITTFAQVRVELQK